MAKVIPPDYSWIEKMPTYAWWVLFMHGVNEFDFRKKMRGECTQGVNYGTHIEYGGHMKVNVLYTDSTGRSRWCSWEFEFHYSGIAEMELTEYDSFNDRSMGLWNSGYIESAEQAGFAVDNFHKWLALSGLERVDSIS